MGFVMLVYKMFENRLKNKIALDIVIFQESINATP